MGALASKVKRNLGDVGGGVMLGQVLLASVQISLSEKNSCDSWRLRVGEKGEPVDLDGRRGSWNGEWGIGNGELSEI